MFCPSCGQQTEQSENFCSACGYNFRESSEASYPEEQYQSATAYKVFGWIFAAISILLIPVLFGAGAFIMGYLVRKSGKHNETHGTILMVMAIACGIFGMLLGMAAAGY